jgi:6-pyruvoyltetrahydropterin/6-carboxytetrahydropterin synthase
MTTTMQRFELSQSFYFEAAHTLIRSIEAEGSKRIHGHTYEAEVTIIGTPDKGTGMLMDLAFFKNEINVVREKLDHQFLDEVIGLGPPTLENLCLYINTELEKNLASISKIEIKRRASGDKCTLHINS